MWRVASVIAFVASVPEAVVLREEKTTPEEGNELIQRLHKVIDQLEPSRVASLEASLSGKMFALTSPETFGSSTGSSTGSSAESLIAPPLPGVRAGLSRPKVVLGQDIDWPPYAYLGVPPESEYEVAGIGHDVAKGLSEVCDIDVTVVQTSWSNCWTSGTTGTGILNGHYHGCMTYTHTAGVRPRMLEFTDAFLKDNKPAGLITRLDNSGNPVVSPTSNLNGVTVVDVTGWAPTADTLAIVKNSCTGEYFSGFNMVSPASDGNDAAMQMLMDGSADAMWLYADQAYNYQCGPGVTPGWDCTLWDEFGTAYAYIHTGLYGHALNGTTLAISKKGSGLADVLNPCIKKYMATESYYNVCTKHGLESSCYANEYFPGGIPAQQPWEIPTNEATSACSSGYCSCSSR